MIDLTQPKRTFVVPTSVHRDGGAYMGPDVKVNAHNAAHAKEVAKAAGHIPNPYFEPREVT